MTASFTVNRNINAQSFGRQYRLNQLAPFNGRDSLGIINNFRQFVGHDAGVGQPVKIEVIKRQLASSIFATNRKAGASYGILTTHALS